MMKLETSKNPQRLAGRDRWRTVRTITCELRALTGPSTPARFGRPLAGPEMVIELPSFGAHMLHTAVVPVRRMPLPAPTPTPRASAAQPSRGAFVGALVFFGITGIALGSFIALASG